MRAGKHTKLEKKCPRTLSERSSPSSLTRERAKALATRATPAKAKARGEMGKGSKGGGKSGYGKSNSSQFNGNCHNCEHMAIELLIAHNPKARVAHI